MAKLKYSNGSSYESLYTTKNIDNSKLNNLKSDLYFSSGDTYAMVDPMPTGGFVSNSTKDFYWNLYLPKSMKNITTITDNGSGVQIRQNSQYLCGGGSTSTLTADTIVNFSSFTYDKIDDHNLRVVLRLSAAEPNGTNNSPIGVLYKPNLKFS